ncbi:hypothetical protein ACLKA7_000788 [Drosophila subpalustris]
MHELMQREKGRGAVDFIHSIQKLASRLREPLPEERLIKIAKKGLRDDLARYVYALEVYTIDQLRDECSEVEKAFGRRNPRPSFEVDEARVVQRAQRRAGCWNCESADHEFRNCMAKERKIFCYRCGRPDTFCPQCPDCAGNWQRSATRAGESRPGMNLVKKIRAYFEARNRIFDERLLDGMRLVTRKMKKARDRFKRRRQVKRQVVAAVARTVRSDPLVFAEFILGGRQLRGLLDSGATVSLLGRGCREHAEELNLPVKPYVSTVRTASGEDRSISGRLVVPVEYKAPDVVGSEVPVVEAIDENQGMAEQIAHYVEDDGARSEPEAWELEESQKSILEEVKAKFLAFEKPVKDRHYPLSPAMQQVVWDEVDKMLAIGVIEESNSPWSNRTTVVRRPDKNRFCLDARKLNALTVKDAYPLPSIEGIMSRVDQTYFISSVDLKFAFWQIELDEGSKAYTAFTRLCRLMDKVIPTELRSNVFVYLDDLLIIAPDFETHIVYLIRVAECLKAANLTIGLKKSQFCFKSLKYLEFIIGGGTLRTDPTRVTAIEQIPVPRSVREVRAFLGTTGWYRRFIRNFTSLAVPLTDALKARGGKKFVLSEDAVKAVHELKKAMTTAPVLVHADFRKRFYVQCDASHAGVGAVLFQLDESEHERPIAYFSAKLNKHQLNYSVTKKECLGPTWRLTIGSGICICRR